MTASLYGIDLFLLLSTSSMYFLMELVMKNQVET